VRFVNACGTLLSERDLAPALRHELVLDLEDELALEHVERLVEVMRVQIWAFRARRDDVLDHGYVPAGLLAAQHDLRAELRD
jgi:hypothetical protein